MGVKIFLFYLTEYRASKISNSSTDKKVRVIGFMMVLFFGEIWNHWSETCNDNTIANKGQTIEDICWEMFMIHHISD